MRRPGCKRRYCTQSTERHIGGRIKERRSWEWLHALTDRAGHHRRASPGGSGSGPAPRQNRFLPELTGGRTARRRFRSRGSSARRREPRPAPSTPSRLTREFASDAQGTGRSNPIRRGARSRDDEGTARRDSRTIVGGHAIARHSGDGRSDRSPPPSRAEPRGPRHQNLVAPSPALVHPSVRSPAAHVRCGQATFRIKPRRPPPASVADKPWRHSNRRSHGRLVMASARSDPAISGLDASWPSA